MELARPKEFERKKKSLKKIGKIGIFDPLWSGSTARVKSPLKVPLALLTEGEVSQASYKAVGSKREEIIAFEIFKVGCHLEKSMASLHIG